MKIKMVVVDLELSSRAKRVVAAVAVPLLVMGGSAVAYANVPHSWEDGHTLKAVELNANFDALDQRASKLENNVVALEAKASTSVLGSELNKTDPESSVWQGFAGRCIDGANSVECTVAANRKCVYAHGYKAGWFVGEWGSSADSKTRTIACIK
jgi:hypothetical protein